MRDIRIGFIGVGNMGGTLLKSLIKEGFPAQRVMCSDIAEDLLRSFAVSHGVHVTRDNTALAQWADVILLAVKPMHAKGILEAVAPDAKGKAILSIVAGLTSETIRRVCPETRVLRVMPNTPAMAGEGLSTLSTSHDITADELAFAERLFAGAGQTMWMDEANLDVATALGGSSPAYVYIFIEALADAGVRNGLTRDQAIKMAAQTVRGAATMVLETGKHPSQLKDEVCSPAGTTIEGVFALERAGFRSAVMSAMDASVRRARELGQNA